LSLISVFFFLNLGVKVYDGQSREILRKFKTLRYVPRRGLFMLNLLETNYVESYFEQILAFCFDVLFIHIRGDIHILMSYADVRII